MKNCKIIHHEIKERETINCLMFLNKILMDAKTTNFNLVLFIFMSNPLKNRLINKLTIQKTKPPVSYLFLIKFVCFQGLNLNHLDLISLGTFVFLILLSLNESE